MIERHLSDVGLERVIESARLNDESDLAHRLQVIQALYDGAGLAAASDRANVPQREASEWLDAWNESGLRGLRSNLAHDLPEPREDYAGSKPAETWFTELDQAVIQEGRCIQCGACVAVCPVDTIGIDDDDLPELVQMCIGCSRCWDFCPRGGLRYERQWTVTGGTANASGAGDPITEFSARVQEDWRDRAQDGGVVTSLLVHLLEAGEIDGALIATESDEEPWKAESFLATTPEECIENAGSFYNQTMALERLDVREWREKLEGASTDPSIALVGTPCEIEGLRALQDFEWDYGSHEGGVTAIEYTIALMCTKNFNYWRLFGEQLEAKRDIPPADIGKLDVLHGDLIVYDHNGEEILREDVEHFHDAALKGCEECADFTGYCADIAVGSVGSSGEYSSVIVRTEQGLEAWELTAPDLEYHDLEDRSAIGGLQRWDRTQAVDALERPFAAEAPRFISYEEHVAEYGGELDPTDPSVKGQPSSSGPH